MRIVFCGGGTGGHVYPALTVANALRALYARAESLQLQPVGAAPSRIERSDADVAAARAGDTLSLLYIGVKGKMDRQLVSREGIDFADVTAGPLRTPTLAGTALGMLKLARGTIESYLLLRRFKPDVVFATGGYGSVGVGFAARLHRLPLLLFEPGPEAGLAVKLLSRLAHRIVVTIPPAYNAMPHAKTSMPGYPVRPAFFEATREDSRRHFGLTDDAPVLLVSGASSGANRLNQAIAGRLTDYLKLAQLMHLCGPNDEAWLQSERARLPSELQSRYHLHAYLHEDMAQALAAAELAVMRSGASVLGELPATRLPAILVPGEYEGWDQSNNARYLESEGAAVLLPQRQLDELFDRVSTLLGDTAKLTSMRDNLQRLARPEAATRIATEVVEMARG